MIKRKINIIINIYNNCYFFKYSLIGSSYIQEYHLFGFKLGCRRRKKVENH